MLKHDHIFTAACCGAILATLSAVVGAEESFVVRPGERQLFVDDHGVADINGLVRTMHQPVKRGAVVKPDVASDGWLIQIRSPPVWDPQANVYKLFYLAYPPGPAEIGMAMATSPDGLTWSKSDLGQQVEVLGSTANNRIQIEGTAAGMRPPSFLNTVFDPLDADPQRRFKGLLGDIGRIPITSADGVRWRKLDVAPIPSSDESSLTFDEPQRRFLAFVKTGSKHGRAHNVSISTDFKHWSRPEFCFGADDDDQPLARDVIRSRLADAGLSRPVYVDPEPVAGVAPRAGPPTWRAECYFISVFPYAGLYVGMPTMFYPTGVDHNGTNCDGFDLIQLAVSRDLQQWQRVGNREAFIPPGRIDDGRLGVWDRMQMFATPPVIRDDELWFYYSALKWRDDPYEFNPDRSPRAPATLSADEQADRDECWGAVCLAVLRRDGFVSLDAGADAGVVTTRPFAWSGARLAANVRVREGGELVAEVLDATGQIIARTRPLAGDHCNGQLDWASELPPGLKDRTVRVRFRMRHGELYGWWLQ